MSDDDYAEVDWAADPVSKGYVDQIPAEWLQTESPILGCTHWMSGPRGGLSKAMCDVEPWAGGTDLDYTPYRSFNDVRGVLSGVVRLKLKPQNAAIQVLWRNAGDDDFRSTNAVVQFRSKSRPFPWIWFESTDREDLGGDLKAPIIDDAGKPNWRYTLFQRARPGDVVLHYSRLRRAIVASSVVAGPWRTQKIIWGARGSYARQRGERPYSRDGYIVPLREFSWLDVEVAIDDISQVAESVLAINSGMAANTRGPLYFPFDVKPAGLTRLLQGYAFRVPRGFAEIFPSLSDCIRVAEEGGGQTSGPGQGFQNDPRRRKAIEERAMSAAEAHFTELGYVLENTSLHLPFDYRGRHPNGSLLTIEVKGTSGYGQRIILTRAEVEHARINQGAHALFVLSGIEISEEPGGLRGYGGDPVVLHPWNFEDQKLTPLSYEYEVRGR